MLPNGSFLVDSLIIKTIFMNKSQYISSIIIGCIAGISLYGILVPQVINADLNNVSNDLSKATLVKDGRLTFCKLNKDSMGPVKKVKMMVTAYSSDPAETDDRPRESASGEEVFDGMIAINGMKFGTRVKIPELFGDKIFIVKDRMHSRKGIYHADVWMEEKQEAVTFGAKIAEVQVEISEI